MTTDATLEKHRYEDLCSDVELVKRCLIYNSPSLPFYVRETNWIKDVLENPKVTAEVVDHLVRAGGDLTRRVAAKHPLCSIESVMAAGELAQKARAEETKCPVELDMLANVRDYGVTRAVLNNNATSDETLIRLLPLPYTIISRVEYPPAVNRAMVRMMREGKNDDPNMRSVMHSAPGLSDDDRRWLGVTNCAAAPDLSPEMWSELYALGFRTELIHSCLSAGHPELLIELAESTDGEVQHKLVVWIRDTRYAGAQELVDRMVPITHWGGKSLKDFADDYTTPNPPRWVAREMIKHKNWYAAWYYYVEYPMSGRRQG